MPVEILPGIWLSNDMDNFNTHFIKNKNINCIFSTNMMKHNIEFIYIPFNLKKNNNINQLNNLFLEYISDFIRFINKKNRSYKNIIIHCNYGNQIGPAIITAYISKYGDILPHKAIEYVKYKSKYAFSDGCIFFKNL